MLAVKALISRVSDYTFWLGLRRNTVSSPWEWSTGVAFQYSKWLSWEPDANGDCGAMIPTGEWGAEPCAGTQCFVCMAGPSTLCGQREYFLVHTVKNADEAREHCRSLYTDLVSITSQDVLLDIEQLMNKTTSNIDYWIGLRRDDLQNPITVQSGFKSSPTTRPASSQIQSKQPSTMGSTSPPAAMGGYRVMRLVYGQGCIEIKTL
ncbi:UNVERIFIED_CONTAM: hypothetical protein FKN15_021945 [Acipenser sinensis]